MTEEELQQRLGLARQHVTTGYFVSACTTLPGLAHDLGFHFRPPPNGRLLELEFFRRFYSEQSASYREFQGLG